MPPDAQAELDRHRETALYWSLAALALLLVVLAVPEFPVFESTQLPRLLLVHLLFELFSILVCVLVAAIAWHTLEQEQIPSANVVIVGFSSIAGLDLAHALTYDGMPAMLGVSDTQHAVYFWLAARTVEALTLAAIALQMRLAGPRTLWLVVALVVVLALGSLGILRPDLVPVLFVAGAGVTPFKRSAELGLFAVHLPIAALMWQQASRHGQPWMRLLAAAALIGGLGELPFSAYHSPSAFANVFGHLFKIAAYVLIFRGIYLTALRLPYARLEQAESRLRAMVDSIPFGAWVRDGHGRLIIENTAHARRWGSHLGTRPREPELTAEQLRAWERDNARALSGEVVSAEMQYLQDGVTRTHQDILAPVRLGDRIAGTVGVSIDITALKRAQAQLAGTVHLLELFVRHTPVAVAMLDRDLTYLSASERWITDYALDGQQLVGRHHYEVFPDTPQGWREILNRALTGSVEHCDEERFVRADGQSDYLRWEIRPWPALEGGIGGLIIFTQVITEQVAARREVERLNALLSQRVSDRTRELERVNAELEEFAASVSHDLQAPLRAIGGYASALREDFSGLGPEAGRQLQEIVSETARAQGLIADLLRLARLTRTELHRSQVDLQALARECIDAMTRDHPTRPIQWQIGRLPTVSVDAGLLRQAFLNLLSNAVKFTAGRDPAVISVGCEEGVGKPGELVLCIRDNGAGFDMRYVKRLFGTFQRLHAQRDFEGTGVGLANVKRIIERHGGRVWAEGSPGAGAAFYLALPQT